MPLSIPAINESTRSSVSMNQFLQAIGQQLAAVARSQRNALVRSAFEGMAESIRTGKTTSLSDVLDQFNYMQNHAHDPALLAGPIAEIKTGFRTYLTQTDDNGSNILMHAVGREPEPVVRLLLDTCNKLGIKGVKEAILSQVDKVSGHNALMTAAMRKPAMGMIILDAVQSLSPEAQRTIIFQKANDGKTVHGRLVTQANFEDAPGLTRTLIQVQKQLDTPASQSPETESYAASSSSAGTSVASSPHTLFPSTNKFRDLKKLVDMLEQKTDFHGWTITSAEKGKEEISITVTRDEAAELLTFLEPYSKLLSSSGGLDNKNNWAFTLSNLNIGEIEKLLESQTRGPEFEMP